MMENVQRPSGSAALDATRRTGPLPDATKAAKQPGRPLTEGPRQHSPNVHEVERTSGVPKISTREAALPLAILKSPLLMQTEWAWRRLLVSLAVEQAQPSAEGSKSEDAVPRGTRASQMDITKSRDFQTSEVDPGQVAGSQAGHTSPQDSIESWAKGTNLLQTHPNLAKSVHSYQAAVAQWVTEADDTRDADLRNPLMQPFPEQPPKNGSFPKLSTTPPWVTMQSGQEQPGSAPFEQTTPAEAAVKALWQTLSALADDSAHADWQVNLPVPHEPGTIVPFTTLNAQQADHLPDKVRHWTMADRLVSSIRTPDQPLAGGGLFVIPGMQEQRRSTAVRWQAERWTRSTNQGQVVHHLKVSVMVDAEPVDIHLICAKPSVAVRVETNHTALRARLGKHEDRMSDALAQMGWRLDKWSLVSLGGEEGRP